MSTNDQTILLVDDEAGIRKVLGISLQDSGFRVYTAANGKEALDLFSEIKPPIVLTDIKMPDMDGIELLRQIKKQTPDTEVIMFTGHGDMDLAILSLKNDATDFVTKPIDDEVLELSIQRAQERIRMRRQIREYTHNLEKLVEEKAQQLVEAERMAAIGETIAGLSHTIKNIAGGLRGGMFVLDQGIESDDRDYLLKGWNMIKGNVDKIRGLSLDLINYGKFAEISPRLNDPNQPLREAVEFSAERAAAVGVEIDLALHPEAAPLWFDSEAIQRCLINLIQNAIDACLVDDDPGKEKKVKAVSRQPNGWGIEYRVADNGCGMTEAVQAKIFKSFFSTKGTEGTGIGLMMTRKIIDRHGGEIKVESQQGVGTAFIVRLPLTV